jgi:hypothetical protein
MDGECAKGERQATPALDRVRVWLEAGARAHFRSTSTGRGRVRNRSIEEQAISRPDRA